MKTCMRYLAVIFAVAMMMVAISSVSAANYKDVAADNAHIKAIETMTNLGILGGYEDGTFKPDAFVRRDEMAKIMFVTYTTYVDAGAGVEIFPDVKDNSWAKGYISWCASKEIVGGYEDGTFKPEGNITYDEALKMVCALLGYTDFSSELWPTDVRMKGLIDLKLGTGLENVEGTTALTRAQVVQLVYNAFYKPMYQESEKASIGNLQIGTSLVEKTLASTVWQIEEIQAQIVATKNYGLVDAKLSINATKTGEDDKVVLFINGENKTMTLAELGLSDYEGKTDDIFLFNVNMISRYTDDNYISIELPKEANKKRVTSSYARTEGYETIAVASETDATEKTERAKYGVVIDGVSHYDDNFKNLKRLNYGADGVVEAMGLKDADGNDVDYFAWTSSRIYRDKQNLAYLLAGLSEKIYKYQTAIDSDGDGYYEYVMIEFLEPYQIVSVTDKELKVRFVDSSVSFYEDDYFTGTFKMENVHSEVAYEVGDVVHAYYVGDHLYISTRLNEIVSFFTAIEGGTAPYLHNYGGYGLSFASHLASQGITASFKAFVATVVPALGLNEDGEYNYVRLYLLDDCVVYFEQVDPVELDVTNKTNKAVLVYANAPTEPQFNEITKAFEVYYPARLIVDGKEILVNLDPVHAIDGVAAATATQDGSPYRQYVIEDNGIERTIFPNISVTYTVNEDGYYSLYTTSEDVVDARGNLVEKVITVPADKTYTFKLNESTGLYVILDDQNNVCEVNGEKLNKVIVKPATTIYYEKINEKVSGKHVYVDFYKGNEIPEKFEDAEIKDSIYLYYDELEELWVIDTMRITGELVSKEEVTVENADFTKDARVHLIATAEPEAILGEDGKIYASYTFKNLYTYEDITVVNTEKEYKDANKDIVIGGIYAWDAEDKNYVSVGAVEAINSYEVEEIISARNLLFTKEAKYEEGLKLDDTMRIIAITDAYTAETKIITLAELEAQLDLIAKYNEAENATLKLTINIGTYTADEEEKIAYITVLFMEYDAEEDKYFIAGQEI